MKAKFFAGIMLLCMAVMMPATAMAAPRYYPQLEKKVVHVENLTEIANKFYVNDVVPILIGDKSTMIGYDISNDDIRSATVLGPFPIFLDKETPENLHEDMKSVDSIIRVLKHSGYDFAFLALVHGEPIAFVQMGDDRGSLSMTGTFSAAYAKKVYKAYSNLRSVSESDKIILRIGRDMCFTDDTDQLAFVGGVSGPSYPPIAFSALPPAIQELQKNITYPLKEGASVGITYYLFEEKPSPSHNPLPYILGGIGVVLIGGVIWFFSRKKSSAVKTVNP